MSKTEIKKNDDGTVVLSDEIPTEALEKHRETATRHLGKNVTVDGFRAGKAPLEKLAAHIGEAALWEEMANRALNEALPGLLQEHDIEALGRPHISVTKLAPGNPLAFTLTTTTLPKIELPDYKALARKHPASTERFDATDEEVEENIQKLREELAKRNRAGKTGDAASEKELPEFNDAFVQKLGNFKTVSDFKSKLREQISAHKNQHAIQKRRSAIIESILSETHVSVPDLLVEAELGKMLHQFRGDVERVGITWKDYLAQIKKSENDLRIEWKADAEKRAKTQLVLNAIAKQENITPNRARVEKEVAHLLSNLSASHSKRQADQKNKAVQTPDKESLRVYVEAVLTNEAVLSFLESQSKAEH